MQIIAAPASTQTLQAALLGLPCAPAQRSRPVVQVSRHLNMHCYQ